MPNKLSPITRFLALNDEMFVKTLLAARPITLTEKKKGKKEKKKMKIEKLFALHASALNLYFKLCKL